MSLQPPSQYVPEPEPQGFEAASAAAALPPPEAPEPVAAATASPVAASPQASPFRTLSLPPHSISVVGGTSERVNRVAALDRLASGYGFLTIEWPVHQRGYDLLSLHDNAIVSARSGAITVDVSAPLGRVLIATGTRGTTQLAPSELRVSNGSTTVTFPIDGGTSLGVWPRLSISKVDEFVVIRNEQDPLSGTLTAVAGAYNYDERNFTLAKS